MIRTTVSKYIVGITTTWFADNPETLRESGLFSLHRQSSIDAEIRGYKKNTFYTIIIDLKQDIEAINKSFDKNNLYKIRRAEREGAEFQIVDSNEKFIEHYNEFARSKGVGSIKKRVLDKYGENIVITKVSQNGITFSMHAYLADRDGKRARLLYSGSHFRKLANNDERAAAARGNRYLHYRDILYFKTQGFETLDLGGYAYNTDKPELKGINEFKEGFGGQLQMEYDYLPVWYAPLMKLKSWLKK